MWCSSVSVAMVKLLGCVVVFKHDCVWMCVLNHGRSARYMCVGICVLSPWSVCWSVCILIELHQPILYTFLCLQIHNHYQSSSWIISTISSSAAAQTFLMLFISCYHNWLGMGRFFNRYPPCYRIINT